MLPVWYYRWRRNILDRGVHIDPDAALDIFERLGATALVPVHWGTVNLRLGPPSMPRRRLEKVATTRGCTERVQILAHGQRLPLKPSSH
jgi:L-ascorbate metabolism protein UlaG (beta-lactamase superfamily)